MAFEARTFDTPIVVLGDGPGEREEATGKLLSIDPSPRFPDKNRVYTLQLADGTSIVVAGCTTINNAVTPRDIGRTIRLRFIRWETNKSGTPYKNVHVAVDVEDVVAPVRAEPPLPESPPPDDEVETDDAA